MAVTAGLVSLFGSWWMGLHAACCWDSFLWLLVFCLVFVGSLVAVHSHFEPYNKKNEGSEFCFGVCTFTTFVGVCLFVLLENGLYFFCVLFNFGAICALGSISFSFVEKKFDEGLRAAVGGIREALMQRLSLPEVQAAVLEAFFIYLLPSPRRKPHQTYSSDCEFREKQTEERQKEINQKLEKIMDTGVKVAGGVLVVSVLWESGLLSMVLHAIFSDTIQFSAVFILGAGVTLAGIWLRSFTVFGLTPFVMGNFCLVISSWYLKGPVQQLEHMFDSTRAESSKWTIIAFVLTQLCVLQWDSFILATFFCLLNICSLFWYSLSFVLCGYGRNVFKFALKKNLSSI